MNLIIDRATGNLVFSVFAAQTMQLPQLIFGSNPDVSLSVVDAIPGVQSGLQWQPLDLAGYTCTIGLGLPALQPFGGTYTVTFMSESSAPIAFDAPVSTISTIINAISTIISIGGVTVQNAFASDGTLLKGYFVVIFAGPGSQPAFTSDGTKLTPVCTVDVQFLVVGTDTVICQQLFRISQNAACVLSPSVASSQPLVVVAVLTAPDATHNGKYAITLAPMAIDGTFSLTIAAKETGQIAWNADPGTIKTAIESLSTVGTGNTNVSSLKGGGWQISYVNALGFAAAPGTPTGDGSGLAGLSAATGILNITTGSAELLLGNNTSVDTTLEVQITPSGGMPSKISQQRVTLLAPIINPETVTPLSLLNPSLSTFLPGISRVSGLTSNSLDSIITINLPRPQLVQFYDTDRNALVTYLLETSTDATDAPSIQRAGDYSSTNHSVWFES